MGRSLEVRQGRDWFFDYRANIFLDLRLVSKTGVCLAGRQRGALDRRVIGGRINLIAAAGISSGLILNLTRPFKDQLQ